MEKSKTTPDAYPMTLAGLTTGCNQKSNRAPISNYSTEQVETIIDELRAIGAVAIIQGSGRVTKVRHYAYNWMGLDKVEAAVMTELLLRGEQTIGELRTRASRMEPIQDLDEIKRIVDGLMRRNLMVELSPAGRGQVVSHNLYPEWELEAVTKSVAAGISGAGVPGSLGQQDHQDAIRPTAGGPDVTSELEALREQVALLTQRLEKLEQVFEKELGNNG
jgi:uncharacterized protein YceH (UPF0502 family)